MEVWMEEEWKDEGCWWNIVVVLRDFQLNPALIGGFGKTVTILFFIMCLTKN